MKRPALAVAAVAVLAACAGILGYKRAARRPFEHRAHVLAGVGCATCHPSMSAAGDEGPLHLPDDRTCAAAGCHPTPHDRRPCMGCHGGAFTAAATAEARLHLRFSHATHDEPLRGNCARCHTAVAEGGVTLRPSMATCLSCHEHKDEFADRACDRCHVDLETEASIPASHLVHDAGWKRTHGAAAASAGDLCSTCHAERFCTDCHGASVPTTAAVRFFDDLDRPSVHRAGFTARHGEEARVDPGSCSSCHAEERCVGCHADKGVGAGPLRGVTASPHPSGWVGPFSNAHGRAARRDPASCASCHGGAGEAMCVSCHQVGGVGGSVHPPGWTSNLDRLNDQPCRMCHQP